METGKKGIALLEKGIDVSTGEVEKISQRGYNEDLLPKTEDQRSMSWKNYFTLWMGSVHNIPNYAAVGGFLFLGLSPANIMFALVLSSLVVAGLMILNGKAGAKYGIPFSMHLRSTYGTLGAKLPGFLRGIVAAIAWFGLQNYTASLALLILIGKFWPGFLTLGGNFNFFGIGLPGLIAFTIFWGINVLIGLGGGKVLNKFTAILNPLIYVVFIGMTVWAINAAGGFGNILAYRPNLESVTTYSPILVYLMIINSVVAVWAAPSSSVADFTQNTKSMKDQVFGQGLGLFIGYVIFAVSSVSILIGGSIYYGVEEWNVLNIVNNWGNLPAVILCIIVLLMTTISTNATGNIVPAAYQLSALFPKKINYKKGVLIAGVISYVIMPWKLMENQESIYTFLNMIGAVIGPVVGVMLAQYYFVAKQKINLDDLYMDEENNKSNNAYYGVNKAAYIATIIALVVSISGEFISSLKMVSSLSFIIGCGLSFAIYLLLKLKK